MRRLPEPPPVGADTRSPVRFLLWLLHRQRATVLGGMVWGVVWMLAQAVTPGLVGQALDRGVDSGRVGALALWVSAIAVAGATTAGAGMMRHRFAVTNWLRSSLVVDQLVAQSAVRLGAHLPQVADPGDVVAMVASDGRRIGNCLDITARLSGALASFAVVAYLLLRTSVTLGLVVLVGVPVLMLLVTPLVRPLHRRQSAQRRALGELASLGTDTVSGVRVLRGMGGERTFHNRYVAQSQALRREGVRVAHVASVVDAQQLLLPGLFVVAVSWLGARLAVQHRISVGDLAAFYGYAAFLVIPLRTVTEFADKLTRGLVAAERVTRLLRSQDVRTWGSRDWATGDLHDPATGLTAPAGRLTVVACDHADTGAALADRLGRFVSPDGDPPATAGGLPVQDFRRDQLRANVLVVDAGAALFGGRLRDELDPRGACSDAAIRSALEVADAADVLGALPEGMATVLDERGLSLSGGQRQRLVLARALLADPAVLVLVDPTSAVDAHTEQRIAERLGRARRKQTTVIVTASPLLARQADRVAVLVDGRVVAEGRPEEVALDRAYRAVVTRELQP